jgi:hypothetical protein
MYVFMCTYRKYELKNEKDVCSSIYLYIVVITPDVGRNCRLKRVMCVKNKRMLQHLCY